MTTDARAYGSRPASATVAGAALQVEEGVLDDVLGRGQVSDQEHGKVHQALSVFGEHRAEIRWFGHDHVR